MAEIIDFQIEKIKRQSRNEIISIITLIYDFINLDDDYIDDIGIEKQVKCIKSMDQLLVLAFSCDKSVAKYLEKDMPKFVEAKNKFYQKFGHMIED